MLFKYVILCQHLTYASYVLKPNELVHRSAAPILKSEGYREDERDLCARMICKFIKRSIFFGIKILRLQINKGTLYCEK